jgi:hypothetical protein
MQLMGDFGRGINEAFREVDAATRGVTSGTFTVNQHNILAAAHIIDSQAEALFERWNNARQDMRIDPPGSDDVSTRMSQAWNDRLLADDDSYANRVLQYIGGLKKLGEQLKDSAKAYGFTEHQIEAAFKGH